MFNRQKLVEEMVRFEDGFVTIQAPFNTRTVSQHAVRLVGTPEIADEIKLVLYDLLTAMIDDIQTRCRIELPYSDDTPDFIESDRDVYDPDEILGPNLHEQLHERGGQS